VDTLKRFYLILIMLLITGSELLAQGKYQFSPGPDLWYNSIDGIRIGVRLRGQMAGSLGDGPHRLDTGVWVGSKWPDKPISYYASLTEPIPSWSSFGSEASLEGFSSVREGFYSHGITFRKRWQNGFNEKEHIRIQAIAETNKRYDLRYVELEDLWDTDALYLFEPLFEVNREYDLLGPLSHGLTATIAGQGAVNKAPFSQIEFEQQGKIPIYNDFKLGHRIFFGASSSNVPVQYQYRLSMGRAIEDVTIGFSRSRGTLPSSGFERGWLHIPDGPNLRGYGPSEMQEAINETPLTYRSSAAINLELDFPNPVSWMIDETPVLGGIVNSRMYLFKDIGQGWGEKTSNVKMNLGVGLSLGLNLPESLGKNKVLTIRYDVPFWLSDPAFDEPNYKFRSKFGFSNVISW
jgi:hypothetical protein